MSHGAAVEIIKAHRPLFDSRGHCFACRCNVSDRGIDLDGYSGWAKHLAEVLLAEQGNHDG